MASPDKLRAVHENLALMAGLGSLGTLFGTSAWFVGYEYQDYNRIEVQSRTTMDQHFKSRRQWAWFWKIAAIVLYLGGLVSIVLSMSLFREEKQEIAANIASMVQQVREQNNASDNNEPALLASLSTLLIVIATIQGLRHFNKEQDFGLIAILLFGLGWLGNAFAASMHTNSISSITEERLAFTLPGAAAIIMGTYLLPWQLNHNYVAGPALPLAGLGYLLFTWGNTEVLEPVAFTA